MPCAWGDINEGNDAYAYVNKTLVEMTTSWSLLSPVALVVGALFGTRIFLGLSKKTSARLRELAPSTDAADFFWTTLYL